MDPRGRISSRPVWVVAVIIVTGLGLGACARDSAEGDGGQAPATVEHVEGSDLARVTLTAEAAERLGIETAPVRELTDPQVAGSVAEIPYAAVLYDPEGNTWAYTEPESLVFVRAPIIVDRIQGDTAFLSSGPPPGTQVVIVGASELLGTEYQVGEE